MFLFLSVPFVSSWLIPSAAKKSSKLFFAVFGELSKPKIATKKLYRFATPVQFCNTPKKMGKPGYHLSGWYPEFALDVRKTPSLRASVGGGQISLTSVLIGGFVHVLLCLFTKPAPLVCSGPEQTDFSVWSALLSKRSRLVTLGINASVVPESESGLIKVVCEEVC